MRVYECPDCGNLKLARTWAYCSNPCEDVAMAEVMEFGKYKTPELIDRLNKLQKEA